jgi:mRNA interferase MazF
MVIQQGDVVWARLGEPIGGEAGFDRPVIVIQSNSLNESRLRTVICVPLTRTMKWASLEGCVQLSGKATGLAFESVAQGHLTTTLDRSQLGERIGRISEFNVQKLFAALDAVLGR